MKSPLTPISSVLEKLLKREKSPLSEVYFLFQLSRYWSNLAGEEISKSASPIQFKNGILTLSVSDSSHLQEMHFVKEVLRQKINKKNFAKKVKKILFRVKKQMSSHYPS